MVNLERIMNQLLQLGQIGWEPDRGMNRPPYSPAYDRAREYVRKIMEEAGMKTRIDAVGNLFGRYDGNVAGMKILLSGSHLDAVPEGGIYDGPLGVLGALEAMRYLHESGNSHPLEVVAFTGEEGGEMGGTFGSRCFAGAVDFGHLPPDDVMEFLGVSREKILGSRGNPGNYEAYIELHIEQGPVLINQGTGIGIPTAIAGITRYLVTVSGEANHAGTTPMMVRSDALKTAVEVLGEWYEYAFSRKDFVSNVGKLTVKPGSPAIIPGSVEFVLELRSVDRNSIEQGVGKMESILAAGKNQKGTMSLMIDKGAAAMNSSLREKIVAASDEAGLKWLELPSGAMHDAAPVSREIPSAMIFIPSIGGISHSKDEFSTSQDIRNGVEVLARTLEMLDRN